jgi:hypothetical protein
MDYSAKELFQSPVLLEALRGIPYRLVIKVLDPKKPPAESTEKKSPAKRVNAGQVPSPK